MNKAKLKSYAPQARRDFIAAVTARANLLGLSEKGGRLEIATSRLQGDVTGYGVVGQPDQTPQTGGKRRDQSALVLRANLNLGLHSTNRSHIHLGHHVFDGAAAFC